MSSTNITTSAPVAACSLAAVAPMTGSLAGQITAALAAVLIVFVVPLTAGVLVFRQLERTRATAAAWSMVANSMALMLTFNILRISGIGVFRESFLVVWIAWIAAMLAFLYRAGGAFEELRQLARRWGPGLAVGLVAVAVAAMLFAPEHFSQCLNGDGAEASDLASGLKDHFLPYWEIETAQVFGTFAANMTWINSCWTLAVQLLLGETELAVRLPYWIWWFGVFALLLRMTGRGGLSGLAAAVPLALYVFVMALWYTFYTGYFPHMADPAAPGVSDAMFLLQLLLALDCLRLGDRAGWIATMLLASIILYAGPVLFVLTVAAALVFCPIARGPMLRVAAIGCLGLLGIASMYLVAGWMGGLLPGWTSTIRMEYVDEYFADNPRWQWNLLFFGYFLLGCGIVPVASLVGVFWKQKSDHVEVAWDRTVALICICYLLIIMGSGQKNLHYLCPIVPLPLLLWLRRWRPSTAIPAATIGLLVSIYLCWPATRTVFALNRDLGLVTTFETDSYEEAAGWGRIAEELYDEGLLGWQVSQHAWANYAELDENPSELRPLVVTTGNSPGEGYQLLYESSAGVKLYCNDRALAERFATERPSCGPERCPKVFQPIAIPARPRKP